MDEPIRITRTLHPEYRTISPTLTVIIYLSKPYRNHVRALSDNSPSKLRLGGVNEEN